jgi:hypothetical protein
MPAASSDPSPGPTQYCQALVNVSSRTRNGITHDPVPSAGEARDHGGAERTRSVHGRAGVEDRPEVAREEREADTDRCERRRVVLLRAEHEHREAERGGDEHLDEHGLRRVHVGTR